MAGKSNTSATFFAQKKLLGKAHTSNLKVDGEELIGSNIQAATSLTFGETIPSSPAQTLYLLQSASNDTGPTVEYIHFALTALTGTTYDADSSGGGAGSDSGESSQSSGPHTYKFVLRSDYTSNSTNPREGNGVFNNSKIIHETLGSLQLIPPFFSQTSPNPYIVKIFKDDGAGGIGDEIPLLDNIDWNVDYYNGILFLQDYISSKIPAHAKAFAYVGKMAAEVISSGSSTSSFLTSPSNTFLNTTGSVSFAGSLGTSHVASSIGPDANFFVSGSIDSKGTATRGTAVFGGDVVISGSLRTNKEMVFNEKLGGETNGLNTKFTLANNPFLSSEVSIFVNGQLQTPSGVHTWQDYSITGSNVFFTTGSIPESNSLILAIYNKSI